MALRHVEHLVEQLVDVVEAVVDQAQSELTAAGSEERPGQRRVRKPPVAPSSAWPLPPRRVRQCATATSSATGETPLEGPDRP